MKDDKPILVAGATGYVGGRLIPALLEAGYTVRAMGRSLEKLACRPWGHHPKVELVKGDVLDRESLETALSGCGAAYYLAVTHNGHLPVWISSGIRRQLRLQRSMQGLDLATGCMHGRIDADYRLTLQQDIIPGNHDNRCFPGFLVCNGFRGDSPACCVLPGHLPLNAPGKRIPGW